LQAGYIFTIPQAFLGQGRQIVNIDWGLLRSQAECFGIKQLFAFNSILFVE